VEAAERYVEFMGGAEQVLSRAREYFEKGEYRWVAEVVNRVVFSDPSNQEARDLEADAMEQLAYQTESATWRNAYLTAAQELRLGTPELPISADSASPDSIAALTLEMIFNYLGMRLNGPDAGASEITLNLTFPDTNQNGWLKLSNGALSHSVERSSPAPDATVTLDRSTLNSIVTGRLELEQAISSGEIRVEPDPAPLLELIGLLDDFNLWFPVIEP